MANFSNIEFKGVNYPLKDASARDDIASLQTSVSGLDTRVTELEQEVDGVSDIIEKGSGDNSTIVGSTSKNTDSGYENIASGSYSYAEGGRRPDEVETHEPKTYPQLQATGDFSHAEGASTKASGKYSHAQNKQCTASGEASTAIGASTSASGKNSFSAGELSVASGRTSIAMGGLSEATGDYAVAIGSGVNNQKNVASGPNSFALGFNNTASGEKSYAQGNTSVASGRFAIAMGNTDEASGQSAVAIGAGNIAGGDNSVVMGHNSKANATSEKKGGIAIGENVEVTAPYGVALGAGLIPRQDANGNNIEDKSVGRIVIGRYNEAPAQQDIITFGIGSVNNRKTALTIKASGDIVGCGTDPAEDNSLVPKKYVDDRVQANPAGTFTEDLIMLKVGDITYAVPKGYSIIYPSLTTDQNINGYTWQALYTAMQNAESTFSPLYLPNPDRRLYFSVPGYAICNQFVTFISDKFIGNNKYFFTLKFVKLIGSSNYQIKEIQCSITSAGLITAVEQ